MYISAALPVYYLCRRDKTVQNPNQLSPGMRRIQGEVIKSGLIQ